MWESVSVANLVQEASLHFIMVTDKGGEAPAADEGQSGINEAKESSYIQATVGFFMNRWTDEEVEAFFKSCTWRMTKFLKGYQHGWSS